MSNGTLKARELQTRYELEGWVFSINYRKGAYSIKCGRSQHSTAFARVETCYTFGNGNLSYCMGFAHNQGVANVSWEYNRPLNGPYSETIETHLANVLKAYAVARSGSRAALDHYLPNCRIVPSN